MTYEIDLFQDSSEVDGSVSSGPSSERDGEEEATLESVTVHRQQNTNHVQRPTRPETETTPAEALLFQARRNQVQALEMTEMLNRIADPEARKTLTDEIHNHVLMAKELEHQAAVFSGANVNAMNAQQLNPTMQGQSNVQNMRQIGFESVMNQSNLNMQGASNQQEQLLAMMNSTAAASNYQAHIAANGMLTSASSAMSSNEIEMSMLAQQPQHLNHNTNMILPLVGRSQAQTDELKNVKVQAKGENPRISSANGSQDQKVKVIASDTTATVRTSNQAHQVGENIKEIANVEHPNREITGIDMPSSKTSTKPEQKDVDERHGSSQVCKENSSKSGAIDQNNQTVACTAASNLSTKEKEGEMLRKTTSASEVAANKSTPDLENNQDQQMAKAADENNRVEPNHIQNIPNNVMKNGICTAVPSHLPTTSTPVTNEQHSNTPIFRPPVYESSNSTSTENLIQSRSSKPTSLDDARKDIIRRSRTKRSSRQLRKKRQVNTRLEHSVDSIDLDSSINTHAGIMNMSVPATAFDLSALAGTFNSPMNAASFSDIRSSNAFMDPGMLQIQQAYFLANAMHNVPMNLNPMQLLNASCASNNGAVSVPSDQPNATMASPSSVHTSIPNGTTSITVSSNLQCPTRSTNPPISLHDPQAGGSTQANISSQVLPQVSSCQPSVLPLQSISHTTDEHSPQTLQSPLNVRDHIHTSRVQHPAPLGFHIPGTSPAVPNQINPTIRPLYSGFGPQQSAAARPPHPNMANQIPFPAIPYSTADQQAFAFHASRQMSVPNLDVSSPPVIPGTPFLDLSRTSNSKEPFDQALRRSRAKSVDCML